MMISQCDKCGALGKDETSSFELGWDSVRIGHKAFQIEELLLCPTCLGELFTYLRTPKEET